MIDRLRIVYTEKHKLHADPTGLHGESPWRVESIVAELRNTELSRYVEFVDAPEPNYNAVLMAHSPRYVEWVRSECRKGFHYIDPDTYVTEYTCDVAASFAAASRLSVLDVLSRSGTWIILARPGGHHA
ncbi:MAG: hypothetical protein JHC33_13435, partial [Ignisphaera sp.]|nr:hypothetical protein [Ignisphaera sp.]